MVQPKEQMPPSGGRVNPYNTLPYQPDTGNKKPQNNMMQKIIDVAIPVLCALAIGWWYINQMILPTMVNVSYFEAYKTEVTTAINTKFSGVNDLIKPLSDKVNKSTSDISTLSSDLTAMSSKVTTVSNTLDGLKNLTTQYTELNNKYTTLNNQVTDLTNKNKALTDKVNAQEKEIDDLWKIINDNDLLHNKISLVSISNVSTLFASSGTANTTHGSAHAIASFRLNIKNNGSTTITLNSLKINLAPNFDYSARSNFWIDDARLYWDGNKDTIINGDYRDDFDGYLIDDNLNLTIKAGETKYITLYFVIYYSCSDPSTSYQNSIVETMEINPSATLVIYDIEG